MQRVRGPSVLERATRAQTQRPKNGYAPGKGSRQGNKKTLRRAYFAIRLRNEQDNAWDDDVSELEAGKTYRVVVACSARRTQRGQYEVEIDGGFELLLKCSTDRKSSVMLPLHDARRDYQEPLAKDEWLLTLPANTPPGQLSLRLDYRADNLPLNGIASLNVPISNEEATAAPDWLELEQLATSPPEEMVFLHVSTHMKRKEAFQISYNHKGRTLTEEAEPGAIINVAKLMQHQDAPGSILGKVRLFSQNTLPNFKRYMQRLHEHYGEALCLVITDTSGLEIPWEMFELDDWQQLGSIARVARWLPQRAGPRLPFRLHNERHEGTAITYLDAGLGADATREEREMLQVTAKHYASLTDLETRLHQSLQQVSLIYVGCHGADGSTLQEQYPGTLSAAQLVLIDKHNEQRPLAFINACESGRIVRNEWGDSSFVEVFLQRCASGYIGTLGRIGTSYASYIAGRMLALARQEEGLLIAEILRRLRAEAIKEFRKWSAISSHERNKAAFNVLYTFLYVYYGNPLARLWLRGTGEA